MQGVHGYLDPRLPEPDPDPREPEPKYPPLEPDQPGPDVIDPSDPEGSPPAHLFPASVV